MYNPCVECYMRYDKKYTDECKNECEFAKVASEKDRLEKALKDLYERLKKEMEVKEK